MEADADEPRRGAKGVMPLLRGSAKRWGLRLFIFLKVSSALSKKNKRILLNFVKHMEADADEPRRGAKGVMPLLRGSAKRWGLRLFIFLKVSSAPLQKTNEFY